MNNMQNSEWFQKLLSKNPGLKKALDRKDVIVKKTECSTCDGEGVLYHERNNIIIGCPDCDAGKEYHNQYIERGREIMYCDLNFSEFYRNVSLTDDFSSRTKGKRNAVKLSRLFAKKRYQPFDGKDIARTIKGIDVEKLEPVPTGMYIFGGLGTGKTALMCATANAMLSKYIVPKIVNGRSVLKRLAKLSWDDFDTYQELFASIIQANVLFIDDLQGGQNPPPSIIEEAEKIIDARYSAMKPTYITSNIPFDNIAIYWSAYLASRLSSLCFGVPMNGKILRNELKALKED